MVFLIVCSFGFLCVQDRAVEHMMYDDINSSDVRMLQRTEDRKQDDDVVTFNVERCEKRPVFLFICFYGAARKVKREK
jgi:hypothetical protein